MCVLHLSFPCLDKVSGPPGNCQSAFISSCWEVVRVPDIEGPPPINDTPHVQISPILSNYYCIFAHAFVWTPRNPGRPNYIITPKNHGGEEGERENLKYGWPAVTRLQVSAAIALAAHMVKHHHRNFRRTSRCRQKDCSCPPLTPSSDCFGHSPGFRAPLFRAASPPSVAQGGVSQSGRDSDGHNCIVVSSTPNS